MKRALVSGALALLALAGCPKETPKESKPPPAPHDAGSTSDPKTIVRNACMSCHTEEMLAQQRLSKEKWASEVKKMSGWGANLDPSEAAPLADYLAATYGVDAGPFLISRVDPEMVAKGVEPLPDGRFANGDVEKGKAFYLDKCGGCHGADARGGVGVNLVEKPILYRIPDLLDTVQRGRGKMTPMPKVRDHDVADCVAYLRTLKAP